MPVVKGKKYPYTKAGKARAARASGGGGRMTSRPNTNKPNSSKPNAGTVRGGLPRGTR